jgi:hypothetical protein
MRGLSNVLATAAVVAALAIPAGGWEYLVLVLTLGGAAILAGVRSRAD